MSTLSGARGAAYLVTQDPIVVMLAARDEAERSRLRSATQAVSGVWVDEVDSGRDAVRKIRSLYESPRGCPDILVLSDDLPDVDDVVSELDDLCPGVRVLRVSGRDGAEMEQLRDLVDALRAQFT